MEFTGIDKFSLLDYDNYVSIVLFSPACNFRCPFCHNGLTVLESKEVIPFEDIIAYLKSRKGLIDAVVITGGEPTLMPELKQRIITIKELGFKVKLDTNGSHPEVLKDLVESRLIDYVAMDIKNSLEGYPQTCGVLSIDEDKIKESIHYLKDKHVPYEFRTTLVEEFHNEKRIEEMGELVQGADNLFLQKFVDREGVIKKGLHEVSHERALIYQKILQKFVKKVELRGY